MTSLVAPVMRPQAQTGELLQLLISLSCYFAHLSSSMNGEIFHEFYNPSSFHCQRKINIKHLYGNISAEVLVSLLETLLIKQNGKTVLL